MKFLVIGIVIMFLLACLANVISVYSETAIESHKSSCDGGSDVLQVFMYTFFSVLSILAYSYRYGSEAEIEQGEIIAGAIVIFVLFMLFWVYAFQVKE